MDSPNFVQLLDKSQISDDVTHLSLCPTMDLIAVATPSNISVYRLNWNRLLSLQTEADVVCWSSDGKSMFVASGATLSELDLEARQTVQSSAVAPSGTRIVALNSIGRDLRVAGEGSRAEHFFPPEFPVVEHEEVAVPKRQARASHLSLIVYLDDSFALHVAGHDLLPILGPFPVTGVERTLGVFASDASSLWTGVLTAAEVQVVRFDISALNACAPDLSVVLAQHTNVSALFTCVQLCLREAISKWRQVLEQAVAQTAKLAERLRQAAEARSEDSVNHVLLDMLLCGAAESAAELWISSDLSERSAGALLAQAAASCDTCREALRKAQRGVERICFRVNELRGLTRWQRFSPLLGRCTGAAETLWQQCARLAQSLEAAQSSLKEERAPLEAFFSWVLHTILRGNLEEALQQDLEEFRRNDVVRKLEEHTKHHPYCETEVGAFIQNVTAERYLESLSGILERACEMEARGTSEELFREMRGTLSASVEHEVVYRLPREQEEPPLLRCSGNSVALIQDNTVVFLAFEGTEVAVNPFDCGSFVIDGDFYKDGSFVVLCEEGHDATRLSLINAQLDVAKTRLIENFSGQSMCLSAGRGLCAVYGGRRLFAFDLEGEEEEDSDSDSE